MMKSIRPVLAGILARLRPKDGAPAAGVLGSFSHVDRLIKAVEGVDKQHYVVMDVFSPVPVNEVMDRVAPKRSPVRFVTFGGALTGIVGGLTLAIATSMIWNIVVGGKPVTHHVPFVVVGFEAMVLLGALSTFLGILIFSRLPYRQFPGPAYRPEFSNDAFGLWLSCKAGDEEVARRYLMEAGATAVHVIGAKSDGGGA